MFRFFVGFAVILSMSGCVSSRFECNLVTNVGCYAVPLDYEKPKLQQIDTVAQPQIKSESNFDKKTKYIRMCMSYGYNRVDCEDNWNNKL